MGRYSKPKMESNQFEMAILKGEIYINILHTRRNGNQSPENAFNITSFFYAHSTKWETAYWSVHTLQYLNEKIIKRMPTKQPVSARMKKDNNKPRDNNKRGTQIKIPTIIAKRETRNQIRWESLSISIIWLFLLK